MADKLVDHNATPVDGDNSGLRGGTQGGGGPINVPGSQPGGTTSLNASGTSHIDGGPASSKGSGGGTRTDVRGDAEDMFEGSRHISQSDAKQRARDEVQDAPTTARSPHGAGEPRTHQIFPTEKD